MNDLRKAAEMALSCLNHAVAYDRKEEQAIKKAIQALRQALTPEVTPEVTPDVDNAKLGTTAGVLRKEWVGLTEQEIQAERHKLDPTAGWTYDHFARAIEAKLKEKNS